MLNETFSVIFKHCELCTLRSFQSKINRLCVPWYFEAPCGNAFCQHGKTSVGNIFTNSFFSVQRTHLPGFMSSMTKSPQSCACIKEKYMHFTPNHKFIFLHSSQCFKMTNHLKYVQISTLISRENCRFLGGEKLVKLLWFCTF